MNSHPDLHAGQLVAGRYEIRRVVGEGGMGQVYLARDHSQPRQRRVALKVLSPRYLGKPHREERFANEARFSGCLPPHANLAATLGSGRVEDGRPFIAMEYVDGPAISGLPIATGRRLSPAEVCRLGHGIANALHLIHAAGLVHRDLTPTNILVPTVRGRWVPKIIDFSHAASVREPPLRLGHPRRLTRPNEVPGTPGYMPPEQACSADPTPAMDVFSLGIVLWELLADRPAYTLRDRAGYLRQQQYAPLPPPDLRHYREGLPGVLYELVEDCTHVDPHHRPSAQELATRLEAVLRELDGPTGTPAQDRTGGTPTPIVVSEASRTATSRVGSSAPARSPQPKRQGSIGWPRTGLMLLMALGLAAAVGYGRPDRSTPLPLPTERMPANNPPATGDDSAVTLQREDTPSVSEQLPPPPAAAGLHAPPAKVTRPLTEPPEQTTASPTPSSRKDKSARSKPAGDRCGAVARDAETANRERAWQRVVKLTASRKCWKDNARRLRLRLRALSELGRYDECARLGRAATAPSSQRLARHCAKKAGLESSP